MEEPSPRSSRLALAGALVAAIAVGGGGFLLGRSTSERPPPAEAPPPVAAPTPKPAAEPVLSGVLGRAELIALAAAAADSAASGRAPGPEIAQADGRRFELRLPFGCSGPAGEESESAMGWRYDPEAGALRIRVEPVAWTAQDWWPADSTGGVEAVEGFWIDRPWTSSEACPERGEAPAAGTASAALPDRTLALGQIFLAESGRGGRRDGKPFEAVVPVAQDRLDASRGFRLRISGRVARSGDGGPILCRQTAGSRERPVCLVSVVMDEVAVENPATGETLSTWSLGTASGPEA